MSLYKSISTYSAVSILNAGVPFLLLPVLTSYLSVEDYGLLAIVQIFIIFVTPFVSINICSYIRAEYHHITKDQLSTLVSSILCIPLVFVIVVWSCLFNYGTLIDAVIPISLIGTLTVPLIVLSQIIPQVVLTLYQISGNAIKFGKYQLCLTFLNIVLTLILVITWELSWQGRLLAILLSNTIFTLVGLVLIFKMKLINLDIQFKYILKSLKFGGSLIVHVLSGALFIMSDRLFISYYLGTEEVGMYAVGVQVAMIVFIIQHAFNQAWAPYLFNKLKSESIENNISIVKISYLAFGFFLTLPFVVDMLSSPIFFYVIDQKFNNAIQYVFWVALGFGFLGMYKVVTNYIFYEKKGFLLSVMTFFSLVVNLILNYFLLHKYGAIGVAYATAITIFIFFIAAFLMANRLHKMPWLYFLKN